MSLAADHLVASIVHESSIFRNVRLQQAREQGREAAELLGEEGQMLTNEDLSLRYKRCLSVAMAVLLLLAGVSLFVVLAASFWSPHLTRSMVCDSTA